jgi:trans-aconitate 2-methyltransferase
MERLGLEVLERIDLRGDETVLDAGCGTGRVTEHLADRLPRGRLIAVDNSEPMLEQARARLGDRAEIRRADLRRLELPEQVDVVISTATFHWIEDHDLLFASLAEVLVPGGRLVAQCGGAGNIRAVLAAADSVARRPQFAEAFSGWRRPSHFAGAEETAERLSSHGFTEIDCRLTPRPVRPDDPRRYLATISLGPHLEQLPAAERPGFVAEVASRLPPPVTIDYVRLDIDARRDHS